MVRLKFGVLANSASTTIDTNVACWVGLSSPVFDGSEWGLSLKSLTPRWLNLWRVSFRACPCPTFFKQRDRVSTTAFMTSSQSSSVWSPATKVRAFKPWIFSITGSIGARLVWLWHRPLWRAKICFSHPLAAVWTPLLFLAIQSLADNCGTLVPHFSE